MSGGLAPSKSTVYVSNLPFSLTNNDLHKILEKYGRIAKVTILKDRHTRLSKGVAFVLFLERDSAYQCVRAINMSKMFGRTIKCSIAKDNGRTTEFIKRRIYKDKSRCYECGEEGHLSYLCPKNLLGEREPPKKKKKRKYENEEGDSERFEEDLDAVGLNAYGTPSSEKLGDIEESDDGEDPALDSLASAIQFQQEKVEEEDYRFRVASGNYQVESDTKLKKKTYKKSGYFSDEEELDD